MKKKSCCALVLAAGQGKRMGTTVQKQFLELQGKPILFYSLDTFEKSEIIDNIILVTGKEQIEYCQKEIVEKYGFQKVTQIVAGGKERYNSVWNGLQEVEDEYVFIHDGARPFVTEDMIVRAYDEVIEYGACVVGMPVKDTIKVVDAKGFTIETPDRDTLWLMQTPQVFKTELVKCAYGKLMQNPGIKVTDDAQVVELMMYEDVKMVKGSYENIKITTPEDLRVAEIFLTN